ncbi:MAG: 4Fe-4S ferredoxin [Deltaproteobacteria bacterium HGW-Deltaproteobacteria-19]|jgi:ferredoxin/biotin operon repressor|nr:MAG: 4Fe-4S ferredoxin [Deltaproteobacteria bacterium HGW-Deltaproteobacteria-19]
MSDEVYARLRRFLDTLPSGFPETPNGVEIRILKKMFTPEDAEFVMKLKDEPESGSDIALRIEMNEAEVSSKLEELATKGLIFRTYQGDRRLYQAYSFVIGLYEFQVNRLDREFCELYEEYLPYLALSTARLTSQYRVIPVESSLEETAGVTPYNRIREIIRGEGLIALTPCICKQERGLLGHPCTKPQEVCMMFGNFARFYIDNGYGREIGLEEALQVLDVAEANGLVLTCSNALKLETLCCCCTCCCPTLKNIKVLRSPARYILSYYRAIIDDDACVGCDACVEICPMNAIGPGQDAPEISEKRCIGCGLCVGRCPAGALSLMALPDRTEPPPTVAGIMERIAAERGLR